MNTLIWTRIALTKKENASFGHGLFKFTINARLGKMNRSWRFVVAFAIALAIEWTAQGADPAEPLLRELRPAVTVESSVEIPTAQTKAIGQKLGAEIQRLTNSVVRVHGRSIQVNAMTAIDESNAKAIHAALAKVKSYPFCTRKGQVVIEYVGKNIDAGTL